MIFEVPGHHFVTKNGPKMGSKIAASMLKALRKPLEASWSALGALLEAS